MPDEKYCYPNTDILINRFNIKDPEMLHEAERKITIVTIARLNQKAVRGNFNLKHLQSIHKGVFSDIYSWAGKNRTVDIAKSNLFCRVQFLDSYAEDIFYKLRHDKYLIGMNLEQAVEKLAQYMGDINALHPFREGNGRTQRLFLTYLAKATGLKLDMRKTDADSMMDASISSFHTDYSGFREIFREIALPMSMQEQEKFLQEISKEAYKVFQELKQQGQLPDREAELGHSA